MPHGATPSATASAPSSEHPRSFGCAEREALARQFRVLGFLGAGPDGTALLAARLDGGAEVELRFVQEHAQTDVLLERWARYQLLHHPHVISLEQVESAGSEWCAVLGTPTQSNLEQSLAARSSWRGEQSIRLLEQLASALAAAHELGLWHGSLAADSVWLDERGVPRLELTGVVVGRGALPASGAARWQDADASADVLALALLAEEMLGGEAVASARLPWLTRLKDDDPCRRPSAREITELLRGAVHDAAAARRFELSTLDTEPPAAPAGESGADRVGAVPPALAPTQQRPSLGDQVGRFRLEKLLGQGGMGSVYRAVDLASGQIVALKLLEPELLEDETVRYRFKKEARVLKAVQSPYIANLIEAEVTETLAYIALEFVPGRDLATALDAFGAGLDETLALRIVADICRALVEPHRRGIVHRDIKPQNVLLLGELTDPANIQIKLCDFGIASARLSGETLGMTLDGRLWGTPQYMAPEQCTSAPVSPATDVYALGLTLYELLAGRPAFDGSELLQILRKQVHETPPDLTERAAISAGTAEIVARALAKAPGQRFADAAELLAAIERVRDGRARAHDAEAGPVLSAPSQRIEFSIELSSAADALWPYVSDTDRMNQVVGLPPIAVERVSAPGSRRTFLANRVLGMNLRWQEYPFEWVEGRRWSVLRVFESGLMSWYRVELELEPSASGGTRLRYAMEFAPRYAWLSFLVRFEVGVKQKAKLLRIFQRVDELLARGEIHRTPSPHAAPERAEGRLARRVEEKLDALAKANVDAEIRAALARHVIDGSEAEIAKLRPLRFARARGLPERAVVEACLLAAHAGLFQLLWDVLCPLCQIPATFADSLRRLETHGSCPACELSFPLRFADSVELVFRVAPEVRANEIATYCIGGPAHSPHVAAQLRLGPGEGRVLALELQGGRHRVRSPELPGVLELDVGAEHALSRADLVVGPRLRALRSKGSESGDDPRLALEAVEPVVRLGSGHQILGLRNELSHEVTLRVERAASRDDALTAARAWSIPKFRELFPSETLESGRLAAVGQVSFMVLRVIDHLALMERRGDAAALAATLRAFDRLQVIAERHQGLLVASGMDVAIAAFERPDAGVAAALALVGELGRDEVVPCSIVLHRGPAVATRIDERMAYYGRTLVGALELSISAGAGQLVVSSAAIADDVAAVSARAGLHAAVQPAPMLGPALWCVRLEPARAEPSPRGSGAESTLRGGAPGAESSMARARLG